MSFEEFWRHCDTPIETQKTIPYLYRFRTRHTGVPDGVDPLLNQWAAEYLGNPPIDSRLELVSKPGLAKVDSLGSEVLKLVLNADGFATYARH
jgi:hypothetical protein